MVAAAELTNKTGASATRMAIATSGDKVAANIATACDAATSLAVLSHVEVPAPGIATVGSVTPASGQIVTLIVVRTFSMETEIVSSACDVDTMDRSCHSLRTDVGFVAADKVPFFEAGTIFLTAEAAMLDKSLSPSQRVIMPGAGPQPVRRTPRRGVPTTGKTALNRIGAGSSPRARHPFRPVEAGVSFAKVAARTDAG
jgi:hypothetical protein